MNDPDTRAAATAALLDLVHLRQPVDEAGEALAPHVLRAYQGAPLVILDRAAMREAITACRAGKLTSRELRHWALMVHMELTQPVGYPGRDPLLGWEPRSRMLLHHHVHGLLEAGEDGVTPELLQEIEADLKHTDWGWIARKPGVTAVIEIAAIALWALVIAPVLIAPWLPDTLTAVAVGSLGGYAVTIAIMRWLEGPESAIECVQTFLPFALLGVAMVGAAYALGGTG